MEKIICRVLALTTSALLIVACGDQPDRAAPTVSPIETTTPTAPRASPETTAPGMPSYGGGGISEVCKRGVGYPNAAEYRGSGPHPIAIIGDMAESAAAEHGFEAAAVDVAELPTEWEVASPTQLQLVACVDVVALTKVQDCDYYIRRPQTTDFQFRAELFSRTLEVEIRAMSTGQVVSERVQVTTEENTCAPALSESSPHIGEPSKRQYGVLTDSQIQLALAAWVTATV